MHTSNEACADPDVFVRGVQLFVEFLVDEGRKDRNTSISGPSSARQRADDGPTLNDGLVALWFSGDPDQYC